jgi:hypothetical protein
MKKYCFILFVVAIVFISLLSENSYAECSTPKILSIPETIGETSVLNGFVQFLFECNTGKVDITLENESTPISVERGVWISGGGYASIGIISLKKDGGWGDREVLRIPEEAFCLKNYSEKRYVTVNVSKTPVYVVEKGKSPRILGIDKPFEINPSANNYSNRYYALLKFSVEPVCRECIYHLNIFEGEKGDPNRKSKTIKTMIEKAYDNSGYYLYVMVNPPCCDFNCGINYETSTDYVCNGLWFSLQIEDSYGNLSEVSEEYKFMPSQDYIDKYCSLSDAGSSTGDAQDIPRGDTGQRTDTGSNVNINSSNSDSGGCSILTLE